jgi:type VI secretion system protein VasG
MTSNIGSDLMMKALDMEKRPTPQQLLDLVRQEMYNHFQPAFLARTKTIPFYPLNDDAIVKIVELKLNSLAKRLQAAHRIEVTYNKPLTKLLAEQCSVKEMGARNVDHVIERVLLPDISRSLVEKLADNEVPSKLTLTTGKNRTVSFKFA